MFKRVRWMGIGAVAGFGASLWMQQRIKRTIEEHPSIRVGAELASLARKAGRDVRDAVQDGREAMVQREEELRAELAARLVPIRPDTPLLQAAVPNPRHPSRRPGRAGPQLRVVADGTDEPGGRPGDGDPVSIPATSRITGPGTDASNPPNPPRPPAAPAHDTGDTDDTTETTDGLPPAARTPPRGDGRPGRRRH